MKAIRLTLGLGLALGIGMGAVAAQENTGSRNTRAEVRFLEGMMDHHQMALDMANDCLMNVTTESVLTLCQGIIDSQSAEIDTMHGYLLEWYNTDYLPVSMMMGDMEMGDMNMGAMATETMPDMAMPVTDDPVMMMGMMAGLARLEGIDYEIAWLESMIDHHDDALHMSERILPRAEHAELRALAEQIIADQSAEIETMEALLAELGGAA